MKKILLTQILIIVMGFIIHMMPSEANERQTFNPIDTNIEMSDSLQGFDSFTNIVIFIRFADELDYQAPYNTQHYDDMFNKVGDGVVSVRDYYLEVSYGQQDIYSELIVDDNNEIIFYTDIYNRNYYEPYDEVDNPTGYDESDFTEQAIREHALLGRAINFVDENNLIDDSINLDVNGDGDIDALTFLVSGEDNGWSSLLWPHQWVLYTDYNSASAPKIDGLKAYTYTFNLLGNDTFYDYKTSVGILAHETFHLLGAPDLYHYNSHFYLDNAGPWSLMDNNAEVPPHILGYMRYQYGGWIDDVQTITTSGTYTLQPIMDSPSNLLRIATGYSNEFVYLEYRVQKGDYESTLPQSGLIVYRVDKDFYGNADGYSETDNGPGINEVFLFRPGIQDTTEPITFPLESDNFNLGGDLYEAALSQNNPYQEAGVDNQFILFHSDGTRMQVSITNVIEANGEITFDVSMEVNLNIQVSFQIDGYDMTPEELLFDDPNLEYEGTLVGVDNYDVYVSLDGDEATLNDPRYDGSIKFNSDNEHIHIAIYDGDTLLDSKVFNPVFVNHIETEHNPYNDNVYLSWFIPAMETLRSVELTFNEFFELEVDYDFLYISYNNQSFEYTGTSLRNETITLSNVTTAIWIEFISDNTESDYYGVYADVEFDIFVELPPEEAVFLNGLASYTLDYGETFVDPGLIYENDYEDIFEVTVTHTINSLTAGTYTITYDFKIDGALVYTLTREVIINPLKEVTFDVVDDFGVELGSPAIDLETLIMNPVYNGEGFTFESTGQINHQVLGDYEIILSIKDDFNQSSSQSVTVSVTDTTAPELSLNASVDTLWLGQTYVNQGVSITDASTTTTTIDSNVNTDEIGSYVITYTVEDTSGNVSEMSRHIHVLAPEYVSFEVEEMLTTMNVGDTFTPPLCSVMVGSIEMDCQVDMRLLDMMTPGNYMIFMTLTLNDTVYQKMMYVFVLANDQDDNEALWMPKKEGVWL